MEESEKMNMNITETTAVLIVSHSEKIKEYLEAINLARKIISIYKNDMDLVDGQKLLIKRELEKIEEEIEKIKKLGL